MKKKLEGNTRQKILSSALELFNEKGISNTTIRKIAQHLNISSGNLNYHFKYKDEIIEILYFELIEKMKGRISALEGQQISLLLFHKTSKLKMNDMFEYRFFYRGLHKILSENEKIRNHYIQSKEERVYEFLFLCDYLQKEEIIRNPEFENEYINLYQRVMIILDNWINTYDLTNLSKEDGVLKFSKLIFETLYPYLTTKGKEDYFSISK